jgi:hypothetical protein
LSICGIPTRVLLGQYSIAKEKKSSIGFTLKQSVLNELAGADDYWQAWMQGIPVSW